MQQSDVRAAAERVLAYFKTLPCPSVMFQDSAEVARHYLALAAHPAAAADADQPVTDLGDPYKLAVWDAINEYAEACGGDTSNATISDRRMDAVNEVVRALTENYERVRKAGNQ